ncbi:10171_t:CDS:1 [Entrophospora sp. SA101]|nr:10171_t:CDS:1 [Entrophospora sp. SA101]
MHRKNENCGPCTIINCKNTEVKFKTMTDLALNKLQQSPDYGSVNYLKKNDQICHIHYMKYVEFNKYNKKLRSDKIYEEISKNNDNIKINVTENGVLPSKEYFGSLISKIENLESTIEKKVIKSKKLRT